MAEECHTVNALPPVDIGGAAKTSDYFTLENYSHATITILMGVVGNDVLIKVYEAKDNAGATKQFMNFNYHFETTAAGDTLSTRTAVVAATGFQTGTNNSTTFVIEIDASELTDLYPWIAVLTDAAAAALISIDVKLSGSRYAGDPASQSPSAL